MYPAITDPDDQGLAAFTTDEGLLSDGGLPSVPGGEEWLRCEEADFLAADVVGDHGSLIKAGADDTRQDLQDVFDVWRDVDAPPADSPFGDMDHRAPELAPDNEALHKPLGETHGAGLSFGSSLSSEDEVVKQAEDLIRDTQQMVEKARVEQNEKLVSLGLTPKTGDLVRDAEIEAQNVMAMSDRAVQGDPDAKAFIDNWEAGNRRSMAYLQGETHRMESQMEVNRIQDSVNAGNRWLNEKSMEREELAQAERSESGDSRDFLHHLERAKEHRIAAEEADRARRI